MSTIIQIKRSSGVTAPTTSDLVEGELAYAEDASNDGAGAILYIESVLSDTSASVQKIGGKFYTDTVDKFLVNPTTTVGGKLVLKEGTTNGTNAITVKAPNNIATDVTFTLPSADGTNGQILTTNGSGVLSFASAASSSFTISDNQGTPNTDSFSTGGTLTFAGTANQITTTVSNDTITFSLPTDVSITGDLTVSGNDIKMNGGTTALTFSGSGDVAVAGDLKVAGNDIKASDGTTAITMSGANVTIAGNLTVSGTTTTVSSTTVTVNDPLIALANNNTATDAVDIGFYGTYDTSGSLDLYSGLFRDASDGKYRLYKDSQSAPTTTVNISATGYTVATLVANLEGGTVSSLASAITVPNGGTGAATFTSNGILYGNGTNAIQVTAAGTAGYFLYSNAGTPAWTNTIDGGTY